MGNVVALADYAQAPSNDAIWEVWRTEMSAAGCRPRTIREREILYGHLCRWLQVPVIQATRRDLMSWLARDGLSPKTRQNYKSFLHTLFTVMQDAELRADNPTTRLPRSRVPRLEPNPITTEQLAQLLAAPKYRDTQMKILLMAYQGFRVSDVAAVRGENVDMENMLIFTAEAKGGVEVWRPLHPLIAEAAVQYPREGWWFPHRDRPGAHIQPKSISSTISAAMERAGIRGHVPHDLRKWYATTLVDVGADMVTVQHAMRHASPATLSHYVKPSMRNIEAAIAALPDLRHVHAIPRTGASAPTPAAVHPSRRDPRFCRECGEELPENASRRRQFCGDRCRFAYRDRSPERVAYDAQRYRSKLAAAGARSHARGVG